MCDRILVLGANPGHIAAELPVPLPHPRNRLDAAFRRIVDEIYSILTARLLQVGDAGAGAHAGRLPPVPNVPISRISGLLEALAAPAYTAGCELTAIAGALHMAPNELFPVAVAAHMLEFVGSQPGRHQAHGARSPVRAGWDG